jgi:hypothetical protein
MRAPLDERIRFSIRKNPDASDYRIAKNLGTTVAEIRRVRGSSDSPTSADTSTSGEGLDLRGLKVMQRKPAESASSFIKKLPLDKGFELHVLSAKWGIGEDTIRRHAKNLKCLMFVDVGADWIPMVLNPITAEKHNS